MILSVVLDLKFVYGIAAAIDELQIHHTRRRSERVLWPAFGVNLR